VRVVDDIAVDVELTALDCVEESIGV